MHIQQPQIDESTLIAMQQHIAQQAAFSQIPDVVKSVRAFVALRCAQIQNVFIFQFIIHFHKAVLEHNLPEITVAYESGWNKYTEKYYARTEWPEAELIAPLVNDGNAPPNFHEKENNDGL